jgi:hypothetical protein
MAWACARHGPIGHGPVWLIVLCLPAQRARGPKVHQTDPQPDIWKHQIQYWIQQSTSKSHLSHRSWYFTIHKSQYTSQIIFHKPQVTGFASHRIWYFKFHKFLGTDPTPCLPLKADRDRPPCGPRGRPKHDLLRVSGWHKHGWGLGRAKSMCFGSCL